MKTPPLPDALLRRLEPLIETERKLRERKALTLGMLGSAVVLCITAWLAARWEWPEGKVWLWSVVGLLLILVACALVARKRRVDLRALARRVEREQPELNAALLTALDQHPGADGLGYLQQRVVVEAVQHSMRHDWQGRGAKWRMGFWGFGVGASAVLWLVAVFASRSLMRGDEVEENVVAAVPGDQPLLPEITVAVRPGDTEIERGTRLIVEGKFSGGTPTNVDLVFSEDAEGLKEKARAPMKASVEANAFGGMIQRVDADGFYRIVFSEGASPSFKVITYVHPALVRSDATIIPPAYSGQPVKEVKNTQNVSALEGSEVKFRMQVNKAVAQAELYGEDKVSIPLKPSKEDPLMLEGAMRPEITQKYRLHLVDAQDRANKQPPWFNVRVLSDQAPKVEIVFPKRDLAVSPIQEMPLEAKVWDDLGVQKSGAVFMLGGETREVMLSNTKMAGKEHHAVKTMLELEKFKAKPRQLVSYYVWAEDVSPQGKVRRSQSDMFFAEVRHFEDIFREGEAPPGGEPGQQGGQSGKLASLQKQVVNADWKLLRDKLAGRKFEALESDMKVVKESQDLVIQQTQEAVEKVEDAETRIALMEAGKSMQRTSDTLDQGLKKKDAEALDRALSPARDALEALYRAQSREHQVIRSQRSQSSGQSASEQMQQRQLSQLELKEKEKRYEEEKVAGEEQQTAEQQENLQVLNRLKELARRQEALAEKIKELEQQIAQAKTPEEKAELQQQLKRLQEEQEQLLRDLDQLKERMEEPENQSRMEKEMEKLEAAREQVRQAAEQLAQEQTGGASNAATRAKESLEEVREEFRQRTAKRFAEELRQLKQEAAGLAEQQDKLSQSLAGREEEKAGKSDLEQQLEDQKVARQTEEQRERLEKLMDQMRGLSEQAEEAEPLLSSSLNDTARRAASDGIDNALRETRDQMRYGTQQDAQTAERKAAKGIEQLQQGVERAAESVLGSETESLRMARSELDRLLNDVNKEELQAQGDQSAQTADAEKPATDAKGPPQKAAGQSQEGKPGDQKQVASNEPGQQPGQDQSQGKDGKSQAGSMPSQEQKEEEGTAPGEQESKGKSLAANSPGKGPSPGKEQQEQQGQSQLPGQPPGQRQSGQNPSQEPSQAQQGSAPSPSESSQSSRQMASNAEGSQPSSQLGQGQGQSEGQAQQGQSPSQRQDSEGQQRGQMAQGGRSGNAGSERTRSGQREAVGGGGGGDEGGWFFDDATEVAQNESPITGSNFDGWTDRLRRVEEALTRPELRNEAARVLDSARELRADWRRNDAAPKSETIRMSIVQPLVELRNRVTEELARRESGNSLAPLDRDPVPTRYREQVRRYYTELGGGK